jgi:NADP-dependent 3-hydroxy acid dehydrogenase YdfG
MRKQGSGHVMNISSVGGYSSYAGWGVYARPSLRWKA